MGKMCIFLVNNIKVLTLGASLTLFATAPGVAAESIPGLVTPSSLGQGPRSALHGKLWEGARKKLFRGEVQKLDAASATVEVLENPGEVVFDPPEGEEQPAFEQKEHKIVGLCVYGERKKNGAAENLWSSQMLHSQLLREFVMQDWQK